MQRGQNPNQSCHAIQNQASLEIKQIHVWLLHPKSYKEVLEFDKENNTKWADAIRDEMDCIKEQGSLHHMSKSQLGFIPQTNPKCTSQPPKDQGKLDIHHQFQ